MAGLHEKVALVPRSRMPGAYALGPSEKPLLWVSGTPRSLLLCFTREEGLGECFPPLPRSFSAGRVGWSPPRCFLAPLNCL